jgi:hypothetical protein
MKTIKITKEDQFVWLIVTEKAKEIFNSGLFDLFIVYDDDSESLIESSEQINEALENGLDIGIEVGFINDDVDLFDHYGRIPKKIRYIIETYTDASEFSADDCKAMLKDLEANGYTFDYGLDFQPINLRENGE